MKITAVKPIIVDELGSNRLFVKVFTDEGLTTGPSRPTFERLAQHLPLQNLLIRHVREMLSRHPSASHQQ